MVDRLQAMKLYGLPYSPATMRVVLAARVKGHEIAVVSPFGGSMYSAEFQAASPLGRIPLLETEDGWRLSESSAIVTYLDEAVSGPPLFPVDVRERARVREIVALADIELGGGLRHFALQRLFRASDVPEQLAYGRTQIARALIALECLGLGKDWAVGATPSAADCALIPNLLFAELMNAHCGAAVPVAEAPGLRAYWSRVRSDPLVEPIARTMEPAVVALARRFGTG